MKLIGCREHQRYTPDGLVTDKTYIYQDAQDAQDASTFYEVTEGKVKVFDNPRPFNLKPRREVEEVEIDNILIPPQIELIPNIRYKRGPVVHLVWGPSALGKSTLFMDHFYIYETDCSPKLKKELLWCSIIIIGNRSDITPQRVIDFFSEHELYPEFVLVEFKPYT